MRLHLAEKPRKESPPDIKEALQAWRTINSDPRKWASFEANAFNEGDKYWRVVWVHWGTRHSNGMLEKAIETINFILGANGVTIVRLPHL